MQLLSKERPIKQLRHQISTSILKELVHADIFIYPWVKTTPSMIRYIDDNLCNFHNFSIL